MQFNMKPAFVKFAMKLSINASEQLMHLFSEYYFFFSTTLPFDVVRVLQRFKNGIRTFPY